MLGAGLLIWPSVFLLKSGWPLIAFVPVGILGIYKYVLGSEMAKKHAK